MVGEIMRPARCGSLHVAEENGGLAPTLQLANATVRGMLPKAMAGWHPPYSWLKVAHVVVGAESGGFAPTLARSLTLSKRSKYNIYS